MEKGGWGRGAVLYSSLDAVVRIVFFYQGGQFRNAVTGNDFFSFVSFL